MLNAMLMTGLLTTHAALAFDAEQIPRVNSVCNYLFEEDEWDLGSWERDLEGMEAAGFNTVWVVNVWAAFQPDADGEYRQDRMEWLQGLCRAAKARDMNVLLVVAYIGEGWGPKGVDVPVWPLIPQHRAQHLRYLKWLSEGVGSFDNVLYLLCTEEILPATLLYRPNERPECVASFRSWAHRANPDIASWNERWKTEYAWDTLRPAATTERRTWQTWQDHNRWFSYLMGQLLPPMTAAIREGDPDAVIGFHDFLIDPAIPEEGPERPQPGLCGFDFFSIGYYYVHEKSFEENLKGLTDRMDAASAAYAETPLFCGEIGLPVRLDSPETTKADEELQVRWYREALGKLRERRFGYSVWCWRTVVKGETSSLALLRAEDKSPRPALAAIGEVNRREPGAGP
ncbi:MAG: hypothetical protein FJX75_10475 [Armatimonadetes bacterium]|nr:hypothetical protein [Armatimonadota bacterium]